MIQWATRLFCLTLVYTQRQNLIHSLAMNAFLDANSCGL